MAAEYWAVGSEKDPTRRHLVIGTARKTVCGKRTNVWTHCHRATEHGDIDCGVCRTTIAFLEAFPRCTECGSNPCSCKEQWMEERRIVGEIGQ